MRHTLLTLGNRDRHSCVFESAPTFDPVGAIHELSSILQP